MIRYLPALLFAATGGFIGWYNASHSSSVIVLPFLTALLPGLRAQPKALGLATALAFAAMGLLLALGRLALDHRARR